MRLRKKWCFRRATRADSTAEGSGGGWQEWPTHADRPGCGPYGSEDPKGGPRRERPWMLLRNASRPEMLIRDFSWLRSLSMRERRPWLAFALFSARKSFAVFLTHRLREKLSESVGDKCPFKSRITEIFLRENARVDRIVPGKPCRTTPVLGEDLGDATKQRTQKTGKSTLSDHDSYVNSERIRMVYPLGLFDAEHASSQATSRFSGNRETGRMAAI